MIEDTLRNGRTINAKILAIQKALGFIEFDAKNSGQGYRYASAAGIMYKLQQELIKNNVTRVCSFRDHQFVPGPDNRSNVCVTTSRFRYTCVDTGEFIVTFGFGSGKDSNDKFAMKSATADNKYEIAHTFCLGWGAEDPENDTGKPNRGPARKAPTAAQIKAADSLSALETLKAGIVGMSSSTNKEKLVAAYKQRKSDLSA